MRNTRETTDHQSLMRPSHHNWLFGYDACCLARLVLTNALVSTNRRALPDGRRYTEVIPERRYRKFGLDHQPPGRETRTKTPGLVRMKLGGYRAVKTNTCGHPRKSALIRPLCETRPMPIRNSSVKKTFRTLASFSGPCY
jgi:hypothetical protein